MRRGITCYLQSDGRWLVDHNGRNLMRMEDIGRENKEMRDKLGVLLLCPVGYSNKDVGKKLTDDIYWVYLDK